MTVPTESILNVAGENHPSLPTQETTQQLGGLSLDASGPYIETCPTDSATLNQTSVHDIIALHTDKPSSFIADALVNNPECYQELITYLSDESSIPESYKASIG